MQIWNAELLYETELELGESACWHDTWKKYLYVDIEKRKLGCIDPVTPHVKEIDLEKRVGTVVPASDNKLLIALQGSLELLDFETGETKELIEIERDKQQNRCNDGKCDALGRFWIGTMHISAKEEEGSLYCFDGSLKRKLSKRTISNGMCWSKDNDTMYYIDSHDKNIKAYDFDLEAGNISNERIIVSLKEHNQVPDGMCIDDEGMLWVAIWGGSSVNRYNPANGELIGKVVVPAPQVTSCAFGGNDLQQLFITTARAGLNNEILQHYPLSGSLFISNTGVKGTPPNSFIKN